jgi:maltose alpha-D-glucosyltransferase/alpha-amylase
MHVNVAAQRRDPHSFLSWMVAMIRLRKECPEIGRGEWQILDPGAEHVLALRFDWRGNTVITLHNFDERPRLVRLKLGGDVQRLSDLREPIEYEPRRKRFEIALPELGYRWLRVGGLAYAARGKT